MTESKPTMYRYDVQTDGGKSRVHAAYFRFESELVVFKDNTGKVVFATPPARLVSAHRLSEVEDG